jgi:hypothetical protein
MRASLLLFVAASLFAGSGCSLVYNGSRYQGGTGTDGGGVDTGIEQDGGPGEDDANVDVDAGCVADRDCTAMHYCSAGTCVPCDADGDGFFDRAIAPGSCMSARHDDCDDANELIHPGAPPLCNSGVDEGCFDPSVVSFSMNLTEFGFIQPFDVPVRPTDADLDDVDIFVRSPSRAVVFTHIVEARRSPLVAEVDLDARSSADMTSLAAWAGTEEFAPIPGTAVYTEEVRIGSTVHVSEIHVVDATSMKSSSWTFDGLGDPVSLGTSSFTFTGAMTGFQITQSPLLVQPSGGELFWGASGSIGTTGAIYAIGTESTLLGEIDTRGYTRTDEVWASSSPGFGLFTARGNPSYFVWNGDTTSASPLMGLYGEGTTTGGVVAPGAIVTVDEGGSRGGPYALVALPKAGSIDLILLSCTRPGPTVCSHVAEGSVSLPGGMPVPISMVSVSNTAVAFAIGDGDLADDIHFGVMELYDDASSMWAIPSTPMTTVLPSAGMGRLGRLDLDISFTEDTTVLGAGSVTFSYAYLRQPALAGTHTNLAVGAIRACIGYPDF